MRRGSTAFRTSPIPSLYCESNIPSLDTRRKISCSQYYFRTLEIAPQNRTTILTNPRLDYIFERRKRGPFPIGFTTRKYLNELQISIPKIVIKTTPNIPPWVIPNLNICLELTKYPKNSTLPIQFYNLFKEHQPNHPCRIEIYTDGSYIENVGTGAGGCIYSTKHQVYHCYQLKINKLASVFTAELTAIKMGLEKIKQNHGSSIMIYSDSLSSLQALKRFNPKNQLLTEIHSLLFKIIIQNKNELKFCWIPSHCDIEGNVKADKAAGYAAREAEECNLAVSASDMKPHIKKRTLEIWKQEWEQEQNNKLKNIGAEIEEKTFSTFQTRLEEIKFTRIRIGHTRLTHNFILNAEDPLICATCNVPITIIHIILVCPRYYAQRLRFFRKPTYFYLKIPKSKN